MLDRRPARVRTALSALCCAAGFLLCAPPESEAQGINRAHRVGSIGINNVGITSPSQSFLRDFGRLGANQSYGGPNGFAQSSGPLSHQSQFDMTRQPRGNASRGRARRDAVTMLADPTSQGSPTLGRPTGRQMARTSLGIPNMPATGADVIFSLYQQYSTDRYLGMKVGGFSLESAHEPIGASVHPEGGAAIGFADAIEAQSMIVPRSSSVDLERPADLGSVVDRLLENRKEDCIRRGWDNFRQGRYRRAADMFELAEVVSQDDPQTRAQVKIGQVFSAVALHQYSQAINSLRWVLTPNPNTNALPDSLIFARYPDFNAMYPDARALEAHRTELATAAEQNGNTVEIQALRAAILWAQPVERSRSLLFADRIRSAGGPETVWTGLKDLLENGRSHVLARTGTAGHDGTDDDMAGPAELPW